MPDARRATAARRRTTSSTSCRCRSRQRICSMRSSWAAATSTVSSAKATASCGCRTDATCARSSRAGTASSARSNPRIPRIAWRTPAAAIVSPAPPTIRRATIAGRRYFASSQTKDSIRRCFATSASIRSACSQTRFDALGVDPAVIDRDRSAPLSEIAGFLALNCPAAATFVRRAQGARRLRRCARRRAALRSRTVSVRSPAARRDGIVGRGGAASAPG